MRIKSFYGNTVEAAVALARREFGEEAMLVESRRAPLEARHLGEYEVVCALVPAAEAPRPAAVEEPAQQDARLARELAEMRRQLDLMGKTISRSAWSGTSWSAAHPGMSEWYSRLLAADLDGELSHEVLETARRSVAQDATGLNHAVIRALEDRILVNSSLADPFPDGPRIAALVGPPGAGKTTMIAKLAVTCGLALRRPVLLLSLDDFRVAGADQLRSYATILGPGFQALDSSGLAAALDEQRRRQLILIDTPGYGPRDMDRAADMARFLSARSGISIHLVLTSCTKSADLVRVAERFEIFHPSSLAITRVDETSTFGTAFSLAVRHGKPISFLGTGQEIPDDIEAATAARILHLLGAEDSSSVQLAA